MKSHRRTFSPQRNSCNTTRSDIGLVSPGEFIPLAEDTGIVVVLDPDCLDLELTESSVMSDAEAAAETLRSLRELGVHISIDDSGTGYSSLNYLKMFPADCLKVDQSFVRDAATEPNDAAIVRAVITLARSLNLKVIAEGVETEEQLSFLRLLGSDEVQGFLLSRPLPAEEFRRKFMEEGAFGYMLKPFRFEVEELVRRTLVG